MASLRDRLPDPPQAWTDTHEPGDVLEGRVAERHEHVKGDDTFVVVKVDTGNGQLADLPLFRSDLKGLAPVVREGDQIAVKYWGLQGQKYVYTHVRDSQGRLGDVAGDAPPVTDADFAPDDDA